VKQLAIAHSPDSDDAFMFAGLKCGAVASEGLELRHELRDIETLNKLAREGTYAITALSFHAYPHVRERYDLLDVGASFGDGYGPVVIAARPLEPAQLAGARVALPGEWTTAALTARLALPRFEPLYVAFDAIMAAVQEGRADAGVLIHEGQLTYAREGLRRVLDLGAWWLEQTGLPLPLGGNAILRELDEATARALARALRASIRWGLTHRKRALELASEHARGLDPEETDRFVGLYVNHWTEGLGERGRQAVETLLGRAADAGLLPRVPVRWFQVSSE